MLRLFSQRGCEWSSAVVGDGGEMMSLALLMTFSTCDPFNKSVHILLWLLFVLILDADWCSEHVVYVTFSPWFLHSGNLISWEQNVKNFPNLSTLCYLTFLFQQIDNTVIKTSLFTTHNLSCDKGISIFNSRRENISRLVKTHIASDWLTEWGNQLASDVTYKQSLHF